MSEAAETDQAIVDALLQDREALAVKMLREAGWTCVPPAVALPEPAVGQTWTSTNPRVIQRRITEIGPHKSWPSEQCIHFVWEDTDMSSVFRPSEWRAWVRKHNARPV